MDERIAELVAEQLRVLGQPLRIRLLARLQQGPATVRELTESLAAVQQNVSQHLAVMHKAGVVMRRKVGTHVYYELADKHSVTIIDTAKAAVVQRAQHLARLSAALSDDAV